MVLKSPESFVGWDTFGEIPNFEECHGGIVASDDMLDYNPKELDPFFTRSRHKHRYVNFLSSTGFDVPKRTTRKSSTWYLYSNQS